MKAELIGSFYIARSLPKHLWQNIAGDTQTKIREEGSLVSLTDLGFGLEEFFWMIQPLRAYRRCALYYCYYTRIMIAFRNVRVTPLPKLVLDLAFHSCSGYPTQQGRNLSQDHGWCR